MDGDRLVELAAVCGAVALIAFVEVAPAYIAAPAILAAYVVIMICLALAVIMEEHHG